MCVYIYIYIYKGSGASQGLQTHYTSANNMMTIPTSITVTIRGHINPPRGHVMSLYLEHLTTIPIRALSGVSQLTAPQHGRQF